MNVLTVMLTVSFYGMVFGPLAMNYMKERA